MPDCGKKSGKLEQIDAMYWARAGRKGLYYHRISTIVSISEKMPGLRGATSWTSGAS
jgi:hypothetical protein